MKSVSLLATAIETVNEGLSVSATQAGLSESGISYSIPMLVGRTINIVLGLLGILGIGFIVYAGIIYLISQGEQKQVEKAKQILTYSIIGMVVIVSAFALTNYVLDALSYLIS
jgi:hypothetical protein